MYALNSSFMNVWFSGCNRNAFSYANATSASARHIRRAWASVDKVFSSMTLSCITARATVMASWYSRRLAWQYASRHRVIGHPAMPGFMQSFLAVRYWPATTRGRDWCE